MLLNIKSIINLFVSSTITSNNQSDCVSSAHGTGASLLFRYIKESLTIEDWTRPNDPKFHFTRTLPFWCEKRFTGDILISKDHAEYYYWIKWIPSSSVNRGCGVLCPLLWKLPVNMEVTPHLPLKIFRVFPHQI